LRVLAGVVTFARMQTTHKISGDSAAGYAAYLTSASDRGDYYTSGDGGGDGGGVVLAPSRWHGSLALLAELGLSGDGPVERDDLGALMRVVSPADGRELRRAGGDGSRVAGIDMTFSAPKSVSALWAVSSPYERARIEAAHSRAVAGAIARVERDVELLRTRVEGKLEWQRAERLLAGEFVHTSSRLTRDQERGGVPDPQLHSHVVVLGAERVDGRFAAVDSRELFRSARANGAWYRAELAHGLQELGLEINGRTGRDGRYFEVAGVPEGLSERWSARAADIDRAARAFRIRYGRDPRAGELGSLTTATRGTKALATGVDVDRAWRAVAEEYGLTQERVHGLFVAGERGEVGREGLAGVLLSDVTRDRSTISERDLRARAYELAAGVCHPARAEEAVAGLVRSGELVALEGGLWTTKELRERERATLRLATSRAMENAAPVSESSLRGARVAVQREIGAPLSTEQREALQAITGLGGVSMLVGQAGTGKGVVVSAAASAWEREGYTVIGTAVAGAAAKRLQADARLDQSVTSDALIHRVANGHMRLDSKTVVVMDEAGMADTSRLAAVVQATAERESKLLLVGDAAQLSSIGAGGLFGELEGKVPTAELSEVHRARHEWERTAWVEIRQGESARALARYQAHERLHIYDTRAQAADAMVENWDQARKSAPDQRAVMITDASNKERDQINAIAQERRAAAGELGAHSVELPGKPYGLSSGDQIMFTGQYRIPGEQRVDNGITGTIIDTNKGQSRLTIHTDEHQPRDVQLDTSQFSDLSLAYAVHVWKGQGITAETSGILTGGWQTDREHTYVAVSRARERTDLYVSREDLGDTGMDAEAIEHLADAMAESNAKQASITIPSVETEGRSVYASTDLRCGPGVESVLETASREGEAERIMGEQDANDRDQDRLLEQGIE
jgi:conjugative relaxase-like TrwC/TraI family protein